jgi:site-specific DNA-cytosine methylase
MRELRAMFERGTGWQYDLWHVLHSAASCGAAQRRHRYFFVVARVPLGWSTHPLSSIVSYEDRLGDLTNVEPRWESDGTGLPDGHMPHGDGGQRRWLDLWEWWRPWRNGRSACEAYANAHNGALPPSWDQRARPHETDSWHTPLRVEAHRLPNVISGHGGGGFAHWSARRFLTAREAFRLMGFPDTWTLRGARSVAQAHVWSGKQMTVEAARWLLRNVRSSLEGRPGPWRGEQIGEREYVVNTTQDYLAVYNAKTGTREDTRSKRWRDAMASRPA